MNSPAAAAQAYENAETSQKYQHGFRLGYPRSGDIRLRDFNPKAVADKQLIKGKSRKIGRQRIKESAEEAMPTLQPYNLKLVADIEG